MKARLASLVKILGEPSTIFVTPIFQRVYSWSENQCCELFKDVLESGKTDEDHFLGTVLITDESEISKTKRVELIDGQQRMVTTTLFLLALRDSIAKSGIVLDGLNADSFTEKYLMVDIDLPKLELATADQTALSALICGNELTEKEQEGSYAEINYKYFLNKIEEHYDDISFIWEGLKRLKVVCAHIEEQDEPQLVFESLNSRGKSLSTSDLLRNLLFLDVYDESQQLLFAKNWEPVEDAFRNDPESIYLDAAIYAWLENIAPQISVKNRNGLYQAVKSYVETTDPDIGDMITSLGSFCIEFSKNRTSQANKKYVDWAMGRLTGLVSERKLFGD